MQNAAAIFGGAFLASEHHDEPKPVPAKVASGDFKPFVYRKTGSGDSCRSTDAAKFLNRSLQNISIVTDSLSPARPMNAQASNDEEMSLQVRLGTAIRLHRQKLGITQEELAWRADMHRTYVADIERGGRNVTLRSVGHLANALQVSVADLLSTPRAAIESSLVVVPGKDTVVGKILLIEDSSTDAQLVVRAFKRARLTNPVKVIDNGEEALDYLFRTGPFRGQTQPHPQLILLDLKLPGISGIEVLRQLKNETATREIPVVVLTSSQHDRNVIECGRLGAENYIVKPVEFENFSRITSAINLHWTLVAGQPAEYPESV